MNKQGNLTEVELQVLNVLWGNPGASVQDVHEHLSVQQERGYTTTLKQMQRMHEKGLIRRQKQGKQHQYWAVLEREQVESSLLNKLSNIIFGGSSIRLALRALGQDQPNAQEIEELQAWLDAQKDKQS